MSRANIYDYSGGPPDGVPARVGYFYTEKARRFDDGQQWDGRNFTGIVSGSQWVDEMLFRTAGGRWVHNTDATRHGNGPDEYEFYTPEQARDWLLRTRSNDEAVEQYFGPLGDEEDLRPGRPEIGNPVHVRLGDLQPVVDNLARQAGVTRAEMIRIMLKAMVDAGAELRQAAGELPEVTP